MLGCGVGGMGATSELTFWTGGPEGRVCGGLSLRTLTQTRSQGRGGPANPHKLQVPAPADSTPQCSQARSRQSPVFDSHNFETTGFGVQ